MNIDKTIAAIDIIHSHIPDEITDKAVWSVLFQIDMALFREAGQSLTGMTWIKGEQSPEPDPAQWAEIMEEY